MSSLIDDLKKEHVKLREFLDRVHNEGINSSKAKEDLMQAKELFVAHLKKEDIMLYPTLKAVRHQLVRDFLDEMDEISKEVYIFFDKYAVGAEKDNMHFDADFERIYALLNKRLAKEENDLYEEYNKIA